MVSCPFDCMNFIPNSNRACRERRERRQVERFFSRNIRPPMPQDYPLGRYLHLAPLKCSALPRHPAFDHPFNEELQNTDNSRPEISNFIRDVLNEAYNFVDNRMTDTFKPSGSKKSKPSEAPVDQSQQTISTSELKSINRPNAELSPQEFQKWPLAAEEWFARRSRHRNEAREGTASWEELKHALLRQHSEHEAEYTPDVYDAKLVLDWQDQVGGLTVTEYHQIDMRLFEMCHKMPAAFNPRVFTVLVISAMKNTDSFIVAQIPVDLKGLDQAYYSTGANLSAAEDPQKRKKVTFGVYTSIERCERSREDPSVTDWVMATASDAKGILPMSLQKMGVPGAIVKDVGLVIDWVGRQRASQPNQSQSQGGEVPATESDQPGDQTNPSGQTKVPQTVVSDEGEPQM